MMTAGCRLTDQRAVPGLQGVRSCCPADNRCFSEVCTTPEIYRGAANTLISTDTVPARVTSSVESDVAVKSIQKGNMTAHLEFVNLDCYEGDSGRVKQPPRREVELPHWTV